VPDVSSKLDRWDTGWKILVGWMPRRYVAFEGGFTALGTATYNAAFTGGAAKSEFRSGGIVFDILGLAPIGDSFSLFAKAGGIAASVVTNQSATLPSGAFSSSNTNARMLRPNYGAGAIWDFAKSFSLRLEAERFSRIGDEATGISNIDMISLGLLLKL
jgi:hypothetical protein